MPLTDLSALNMNALFEKWTMLMALAGLLAHPVSSGIDIRFDLEENEIRVTCENDMLENTPPLNRTATVGTVFIDKCLPPRDSYATTLQALNIDISSIKKLKLSTKTELNKTHFTGLSITDLEVSTIGRNPLHLDISTIETLQELSVYGSIVSLPQSKYVKSVQLYFGDASGVWSDCEGLQRLKVKSWLVPEPVGAGWLTRCRHLRELDLEDMPRQLARNALTGGISLDTLSVNLALVEFMSLGYKFLPETLLADVKKLRKLVLTYNHLNEIPRSALPPTVEDLDLSHNDLRNMTELLTALAPLQKLRSLNLDENKALDFCAGWTTASLTVAPLLEELFLRNTKLQRLDCFGHWKALKFLDVSDNGLMIQQFDLSKKMSSSEALVTTATSLFPDKDRRVRLAGNSFVCNCVNRPLLAVVREHRSQVVDYANITCAGTKNVLLSDIALDDMCDEIESQVVSGQSWPILLGALLVSSAAALSLSAALCWRYRRQLRVFLFTHGLCLPYLREEETDADAGRQYDAFVSFCHLDDEFVTEHLLPGLQDYKLCIHYRDWIAGEFIAAQITRSIEQSRRTIIVLSRHFLDSLWGMLEFRTAHASTRQEGRPRLVVVLLDDVLADERLDSELRAYLATNTYVRWGERWFWNKLRFALPHRPHPSPGEPAEAIQYIEADPSPRAIL